MGERHLGAELAAHGHAVGWEYQEARSAAMLGHLSDARRKLAPVGVHPVHHRQAIANFVGGER
jgi:hypothetical protein